MGSSCHSSDGAFWQTVQSLRRSFVCNLSCSINLNCSINHKSTIISKISSHCFCYYHLCWIFFTA